MTDSWNWWSRRVLPPGPKGLLRRPFIAIAGLRRQLEYKPKWLSKKDRRNRRARLSGRKNRCELKHFDEFPSRSPGPGEANPKRPDCCETAAAGHCRTIYRLCRDFAVRLWRSPGLGAADHGGAAAMVHRRTIQRGLCAVRVSARRQYGQLRGDFRRAHARAARGLG